MTDQQRPPGPNQGSADIEDLIGRLMSRIVDAETSLGSGRPAELDNLDSEVKEVIERVRALPKEQAVFYLGSLQNLLTKLANLEGLANRALNPGQDQLPESEDIAYNSTERQGSDPAADPKTPEE